MYKPRSRSRFNSAFGAWITRTKAIFEKKKNKKRIFEREIFKENHSVSNLYTYVNVKKKRFPFNISIQVCG